MNQAEKLVSEMLHSEIGRVDALLDLASDWKAKSYMAYRKAYDTVNMYEREKRSLIAKRNLLNNQKL